MRRFFRQARQRVSMTFRPTQIMAKTKSQKMVQKVSMGLVPVIVVVVADDPGDNYQKEQDAEDDKEVHLGWRRSRPSERSSA